MSGYNSFPRASFNPLPCHFCDKVFVKNWVKSSPVKYEKFLINDFIPGRNYFVMSGCDSVIFIFM